MKLNIWKKKDNIILTVLVVVAAIYLVLSLLANTNIFKPTSFAYYNNLIDSFINGRLDVISKETLDLSFYKDKWYLYWGAGAGIYILPFYILSGLNASDIVYTLLAGMTNIILFHFLVRNASRFFKLRLQMKLHVLLLLVFGLMSPNFYLSLKGGIWATNQIVATMYLLLFLNLLFLYLLKPKKTVLLAASLVFFHLAWLTRYTLVFYGLLYFFVLFHLIKSRIKIDKPKFISVFLIISAVFLAGFFSYNRIRFANILETGMVYQKGVWRYDGYFQAKKIFSKTFVPHNVFHYFLRPYELTSKAPFIKFDTEGNSIFLIYPFLFALPFLLKKKILHNTTLKTFVLISLLIIGLGMSVLLVNVGTGWVQFGARYFLDSLPLIYLLLILVISSLPNVLTYGLLAYGLLVNILGTLIFYSLIRL